MKLIYLFLASLLISESIIAQSNITKIHNTTNYPITLFQAIEMNSSTDIMYNISDQVSSQDCSDEHITTTAPLVYIALSLSERNLTFYGPFVMRGTPYLVQLNPATNRIFISEASQ